MGFSTAVAFLTRVPARSRGELGDAAPWFPVVGALVGGGVAGVLVLAAGAFGAPIGAVLAVIVGVVVTGALHLDGLADTADALGVPAADRGRRLAVMKDHAVGVYGTAAVVLALLLEVALLATLAAGLRWWAVVAVVALAWSVSRAVLLPLAAALPYARAEGTGRSFVEGVRLVGIVTGGLVVTVVAGAVTVALEGDGMPWGGAALAVSLGVALPVLLTWAIGAWARRALGGVTGDVLGATAQLAQLVSLLGALLGLAVGVA